jgi:hypothetical protein
MPRFTETLAYKHCQCIAQALPVDTLGLPADVLALQIYALGLPVDAQALQKDALGLPVDALGLPKDALICQ